MLLHFQARLQRGNILLKQGNTQEAREDFEAVVSLSPKPLLLSFSVFCLKQQFDKIMHVIKGGIYRFFFVVVFFFSCTAPQTTKKLRNS